MANDVTDDFRAYPDSENKQTMPNNSNIFGLFPTRHKFSHILRLVIKIIKKSYGTNYHPLFVSITTFVSSTSRVSLSDMAVIRFEPSLTNLYEISFRRIFLMMVTSLASDII